MNKQSLKIKANEALRNEMYSLNQAVKVTRSLWNNSQVKDFINEINAKQADCTVANIVKVWDVKTSDGKLGRKFKGEIKEKTRFSTWDVLNKLAKVVETR